MMIRMSDATRLLQAMRVGGEHAAASAELLPLVYQELRRLARSHMAQERGSHTLQATALVHEAYLRLIADEPTRWENRRHFFAAAAEAMRRILIEHARQKRSLKRGGDRQRVELEDDSEIPAIAYPVGSADELLALNDALDRLAAEDPVRAELVKLMHFAGLSVEDAAEVMGISRATAYRHWVYSRAWLHDAIEGNTRIT
jgi:RNA polymerase sigma factor (TIGR02999 family)